LKKEKEFGGIGESVISINSRIKRKTTHFDLTKHKESRGVGSPNAFYLKNKRSHISGNVAQLFINHIWKFRSNQPTTIINTFEQLADFALSVRSLTLQDQARAMALPSSARTKYRTDSLIPPRRTSMLKSTE